MMRTFVHSFKPASANPVVSATASLDIADIEDAGIREVLQTPGPGYGAWSILDALLTTTGNNTPFLFKEPLGHAREVKVAMSGLFGRFVARAYLEKYFQLTVFAHLTNQSLVLDGRRRISVVRLARGDLPDWIACRADLSSLTVAEAKGCHDAAGPQAALKRAWAQAKRINITARGRRLTIKRIAIATRWANATKGPQDPHISVHDPVEEGDEKSAENIDAAYVGVVRQHIANLIEPLGHIELAQAIRHLVHDRNGRNRQADITSAQLVLNSAPVREVVGGSAHNGLIGAVVTRAGPLAGQSVSANDQAVLSRVDLRPVFVGVERDWIKAAISGEPSVIRDRPAASEEGFQRSDRAGGWIVQLGNGKLSVR